MYITRGVPGCSYAGIRDLAERSGKLEKLVRVESGYPQGNRFDASNTTLDGFDGWFHGFTGGFMHRVAEQAYTKSYSRQLYTDQGHQPATG